MHTNENSKRIAKNTLTLYLRTILTIIVALYTSRVVLSTLGETDYGIYNIVGGVVVLFSFLSSAMTTATQRFLNFELGRGDFIQLKRLFSMSMTIHIIISLLIIVLAETVGLWFVNTQLNIPPDRMTSVHWVYQFSIFSACLKFLRIPYNAAIVAHERMEFFAYVSIFESILNLLVVYILLIVSTDRLITYSILLFLVILISSLAYKIYCNINFKEICKYHYYWDIKLIKQLLSFSWWTMFEGFANVASAQGVNILINIFFGVTVNAAMAIANQVMVAICSFASSFQTAFNPQLVKSYALNEIDYFRKLILETSRFSYFLILIIALPCIISAKFILSIWLTEVPAYSVELTQLILIFITIDITSSPLWMAIQATGKIKNYKLVVSLTLMSNLPVAYFLFFEGFDVLSAFYAKLVIMAITYSVRVFYIKKLIHFSLRTYIQKVLVKCAIVTICALPIPLLMSIRLSPSILNGFFTIAATVALTIISIVIFGLKGNERELLLKKVRKV